MPRLVLNLASVSSFSSPLIVPNTGGFMNPDAIVESFNLQPGMKVADFGSGSGYFTILMAKKVGDSGQVTAVDILESALETVRAKGSVSGLKNLETIRADLEVLGGSGLPDSSQDVVLLANILFQSSKKMDIVNEAKRVLVSGGLVIFIDWKRGANGGLGPPENLRVDPAEMKAALENQGLRFVSDIDAGIFHFGFIYRK
ncbi:MAG: class I SAM-dependent methyltransferase [Candidatus Yanofskybacteria bacterium]|nr:class I SAM-dependent methyltransferase [Candidatus Yanofskybacteria bacterium]